MNVAGHWWREQDCRLDDLVAAIAAPGPEPLLAAEVIAGVPVYDGDTLRRLLDPPDARLPLMAEFQFLVDLQQRLPCRTFCILN